MSIFIFLSKNAYQTKKIGENLAKEILRGKLIKKVYPVGSRRKRDSCGALVFGLIGDLGGGKTTFLQGFAKGLGIKEKILSPTFVIIKRFEIKPRTSPALSQKGGAVRGGDLRLKFKDFYHLDCYRIQKIKEILGLGWREIINNPENIVAVEWADYISKIMPKDSLIINFKFIDKKTRKISIKNKTSLFVLK